MVWKKVVIKIAKWLLVKSANALYNYIDADNDGKLSKREINAIITKLKKLKK